MNRDAQAEALKELQTIRQMMQMTRHTIQRAGAGQFMVLWGVVWLLGFGGQQFLSPVASGWTWMVLDLLGGVGSVVLGARLGRRMQSRVGGRVGLWWLALLAYGVLLVWVLKLSAANQVTLVITLFAAMGYVLTGIMLSGMITLLGVLLTLLALLGYYFLPAYFSLWMAIFGGGTLIGSGLWVMRRWS